MAKTREPTHYTFNRSDADALSKLIHPTGSLGGHGPKGATKEHYICVATSGVPARSGTTLGKATAARYALNPSGANVVVSNASQNMEVYNLAATAVATGSYIIVELIGGYWIVVWEECA
jgi:hypothetical protein